MNSQMMPWDTRPSLLEFIRSHLSADKAGFDETGSTLPDDERAARGSKIRWAPGASDGVATHHLGNAKDNPAIGALLGLVRSYLKQPTAANKAKLYDLLTQVHVVSIIDSVIQALVEDKNLDSRRLYELAKSFTTAAPDREPVKFGIAILGLFRRAEDQELFQTLGRHDEFTLFCAVAIANASTDDEPLWTLAQNVTGWGRIHCVQRLQRTTDPSIKDWLLREGFRNCVMYEYLAVICARAGGLLAALSENQIDADLKAAAGDLIEAMIVGGPAENIDEYEDARPVIEHYLRHMEYSAKKIEDFLHVSAINRFLNQEDSEWKNRYAAGWSSDARDSLRTQCAAILGRPMWVERVKAELNTDDEMDFVRASQAAKTLGIDTWDIHWQRLQQKPHLPARWFHIMELCNEARIDEVLGLMDREFDLKSLGTGASDELGLGPKYERHSCLGNVLQGLRRFPAKGMSMIEVGLKSPVISNRNAAINAVGAWPRQQWPVEIRSLLHHALSVEPCEPVHQRLQELLSSE